MSARADDVTTLLKAWRGGDERALDRLTPLIYDHLRKLGRQHVGREQAAARGDATSLVHEAYVRLVDARLVDWQDRAHFFAVSARIMRRILVDADPASGVDFDAIPAPGPDRAEEICALDEALQALAREDARRAQVIELRFFGGLSVEETAEALGISTHTVMRDWKLARAWLAVRMRS